MIGLTAAAAIIFSSSVIVGILSSFAQFEQSQGQESQGGSGQQEESDGGLTATENGDSFTVVDTIIVRGTVEERDINSFVAVEIIDSEGETVERAFPDVTADNTWQQSFTPGQAQTNIYSEEWTASGNYRMTVGYSVPGDDFEREELEFVFSYNANPTTMTDGSDDIDDSAGSLYTSADGFRVLVPDGWVVADFNNTTPIAQRAEQNTGIAELATLCQQDATVPKISRT